MVVTAPARAEATVAAAVATAATPATATGKTTATATGKTTATATVPATSTATAADAANVSDRVPVTAAAAVAAIAPGLAAANVSDTGAVAAIAATTAPDLAAATAAATVADNVPVLAQVWRWLDAVPDPEIPVISLVDLGVIRDLAWQGDTLVVTVTPTYSGCPATSIINLDIETALNGHGIKNLEIRRQLSPAWTTAWLSEAGREKLEDYGIAPPQPAGGPARCPNCGGEALSRVSQFGSTPCKALWRCDRCLEPFDYFKCI
jgi:ring-1,2-phenylacetyl-CoA epoxidase subunit PaaD